MAEFLRILYNVLFTLLSPLLLARIWWRERRHPTYRKRWNERFALRLPQGPDEKPIWIHAVSVGETVAATPLIDYLVTHHPSIPILITTTTVTGAQAAQDRFGTKVQHVFLPYDLPSAMGRFLSHFEPRILVLMETELWPNLLRKCRSEKVPVLIANARLSSKSVANYGLISRVTAEMMNSIECFAAQGAVDGERFIALGAPPASVTVTGSLKFDVALPPSAEESGQSMRRKLGVSRAIFMAGSTREGEEEILLRAFEGLKVHHPTLLLLLAPRHPERFAGVAELCRKNGLEVVRHSSATACRAQTNVYLIDSMGELPKFYAASDVAFVGGSLVPRGGHNVLEPAALGVPVVVGPHTFNFPEITKMLDEQGALYVVSDEDELITKVGQLLSSANLRDIAGSAGRRIVSQNKGATIKITGIIDRMLERTKDFAA
ncbi:MAG: 3-deoxy-D-manno-octulosonic-acid transferase [Gammaproteobacteria bacterium]